MGIEDILAKLDPKTQKRVIAASKMKVEIQPTPSTGLNAALGGGFPYGRLTLVWGNKSAGKSSLCLQTVAEAQKAGKVCAWVDAEQAFDPKWAARLGVNVDELIVTRSQTVESMTSDVCDLLRAGVNHVTVDSVSSLLSSAYFKKDAKNEELKQLDETKQIGSLSRDLANAVNMINYTNENDAMVVFISQMRNTINTYGAAPKPMGGFALQFFSSTIVKLWSSARDDEQIKGDIYVGDKIISTNVGRRVDWKVEYNKTSPPGKSGFYDFYYGGSNIGVDNVGETVDLATELGIIVKAGAWFNYKEEKFHGRAKTIEYIRENNHELINLQKQIKERLTGEIE